MKTFTAVLFALVSMVAASAQQVTIKAEGNVLTIANGREVALLGVRLVGDNKQQNLTIRQPIAPGETARYRLKGQYAESYTMDAALWADGVIEGPNNWGLDRHLAMLHDIMAGGPAYFDDGDYSASGSSHVFAEIWAQHYRAEHGHGPLLFRADPAHYPSRITPPNPDACPQDGKGARPDIGCPPPRNNSATDTPLTGWPSWAPENWFCPTDWVGCITPWPIIPICPSGIFGCATPPPPPPPPAPDRQSVEEGKR